MAILSRELTSEQSTKLDTLVAAIPEILKATENPEYDEIFGYRIAPNGEEHVVENVRDEILAKFLVAAEFDVEAAKKKVTDTLDWRYNFKTLVAAYEENYDEDLEKLGIITDFQSNVDNLRVVTWNIYANLKNPKKLFAKFGVGENADDRTPKSLPGTMFLRWRVGLMERSLLLLDFDDPNNSKIAQVHDYNNVSMFRMDPGMKAATKEIIKVFSDNYPELLSKKYFINVPLLMGWVFGFFKATGLMSAATLKRFEMLNHGDLSSAFGKDNLPAEYNGGQKTTVPDLYSLAVSETSISVPAYGKIILEKVFKKEKADAKEVPVVEAKKSDADVFETNEVD